MKTTRELCRHESPEVTVLSRSSLKIIPRPRCRGIRFVVSDPSVKLLTQIVVDRHGIRYFNQTVPGRFDELQAFSRRQFQQLTEVLHGENSSKRCGSGRQRL